MKYSGKMLSVFSTIFKVLAWISAGIGIVSFLVILIGGGTPQTPRISSLVALLVGGLYFLFFCTASNVIGILLKIEENTRNNKE